MDAKMNVLEGVDPYYLCIMVHMDQLTHHFQSSLEYGKQNPLLCFDSSMHVEIPMVWTENSRLHFTAFAPFHPPTSLSLHSFSLLSHIQHPIRSAPLSLNTRRPHDSFIKHRRHAHHHHPQLLKRKKNSHRRERPRVSSILMNHRHQTFCILFYGSVQLSH